MSKTDNDRTKLRETILHLARDNAHQLLASATSSGSPKQKANALESLDAMSVNILAQRILNLMKQDKVSMADALEMITEQITDECEYLSGYCKHTFHKF